MPRQLNVRGDPQEVFVTAAGPNYVFGTRMHVPDGRVFRRSQADTTALVAGRTAQTTVPDVGLRARLVATGPSEVVYVLMGAVTSGSGSDRSRASIRTGGAAARGPFFGEYDEGMLYVVSGGGAGHVYRIANAEGADSTLNSLKLTLDSDAIISVNAATRVTLYKNFFKDLTIGRAPPSAPVIGVSPVAVPASHHFWLQTHGAAAVLQHGDLRVNLPVAASEDRAGAVRHAVVVSPDPDVTGESKGARSGTRSVAVVRVLIPQDEDAQRLVPVSGMGVVPEVQLGYVIDPGDDGTQCLVHLDVEV